MTLGTDFSGGFDLDPALSVVGGRRALAEAIIRRLTTTLGALRDYPDYGFNTSALIGSTLSNDRIRQKVATQVFLEEEVEDAIVSVTRVESTIFIDIRITAGEEPFDLTLNINDVGVSAIIPPGLS